MGQVSTEQTVAIIDSVANAVHSAASTPAVPVTPETTWWQIFAVVGGTIATLLTAWGGYVTIKRRKK